MTNLHWFGMTAYAYVFGHDEEGVEGDPEASLIGLADKARGGMGVWRHTQRAGDPDGGFKFIVAYNKELRGEFQVVKKTGPHDDVYPWHYHVRPGSVCLYGLRRPYTDLVNQLHFAQGVEKEAYDNFIRKVNKEPLY